MKITFVVPSFHGGGAEFVARTWMTWLSDNGHDVRAILTAGRIDSDFAPPSVASSSIGHLQGQVRKTQALARELDSSKTDIAIALQAHANLLLLTAAEIVPKNRRPKVVVSERNLVALGLPGSGVVHRSKIWMAQRMYRRADHVVAISHPVAGELVSAFGVDGGKITVVPNPATAKVSHSKPRKSAPDASADQVQLVLPCRLVKQKRPLLAIETAAVMNSRGVQSEVVSFGGGPLLDEMRTRAAELDVRFTHMGWVEDWFEHFTDSSVVLLPSIREGFGNVLVEAAAAGYPSVAVSGALGVADAIVPGITGELSLSPSPEDLADAAIRARGLKVDGIDGWLSRFSVESSSRDLEKVLLRLLSRGE